eukprot:1162127-Pelagomonas_calceolata.AAC.5
MKKQMHHRRCTGKKSRCTTEREGDKEANAPQNAKMSRNKCDTECEKIEEADAPQNVRRLRSKCTT